VTGRILRLGGDEHDAVQLLLPWYDGGSLEAAEVARVAAHLGACARCQADMGWQRRLRDAATQAASSAEAFETPADADRGWAALRGRIGGDGASAPARLAAPLPAVRAASPRWGAWRWVVALQSAVILGLAALVIAPLPRDDAYRALGSASRASDASIVVVFRPDASELQIRQALRDSGARLVDGPTVTGAYLLSTAPARHAAAIERLRGHGAVLRVESLEARPVR
jgi:hypothetical protein